ncbi:hypothetical protein [Paenibacillus jilunlii]|nr:hypothetical protein [Paenibacillus jilunlii]
MMDKGGSADLLIAGIGGAAGGTYNHVSLEGVSRINGPVTAMTFTGNGRMRLGGSLTVEQIETNGDLKIGGGLRIGTMKHDGLLKVDGGLLGESFTLNGVADIKGDCELEKFTAEGVVTIGGFLSAGCVELVLQGQAKVKELGVESLVIRKGESGVWNKLAGGIIPKLRAELQARVIEGDFLDLEFTTAEVVRGAVIIIGEGCSIGRVEYRDRLTVHPGASVGMEEKTGE